MKLDVIIPCYNEENNVKVIYKELSKVLKDISFQIIFVNDGSKDKTYISLKELYESDNKHIKVINFSRNFGKDAAIYAGLEHSSAKYAAVIDADMQQDPKYLLKMLEFLEENDDYDEVAMVNNERTNDTKLVKIFKETFYKIINLISDIKFQKNASDFRMFKHYVVKSITSLQENNRFSKGIFSWVGYKVKYMEYDVQKRHSGKSNFNIIKSFSYAFDGIINFSAKPLRIATVLGFITASFAFIYLLIIFIKTLVTGSDVPGYPSIICLILLLGGINLQAIGIVGEYISKMYLEVKKRPIYVAKNTLGLDDEDIL